MLSVEPIAIMMRKDDPAFKKAGRRHASRRMIEVRRHRQDLRQVVHAADPADATPTWACPASESHQGRLGEPERQADAKTTPRSDPARDGRSTAPGRLPVARFGPRLALSRRFGMRTQAEAGLADNINWDWQVFLER
ncbi:MAG: hypothetical protein MZW92_43765 [Comamonadaceae bacterium]|nr:hypothetical protein [Comamonadaceae bacterium]